MTTHKTHHELIKEAIFIFAEVVKLMGYRVFIAERGTYGFFTDQEGTRVVSFEETYGNIKLSGNYVTDNPKSSGTGWYIDAVRPDVSLKDTIDNAFNASPFPGAIQHCGTWRYTTLEEHLKNYQSSSRYKEI